MDDAMRALLPRYYDGELREDAARQVELHLAGCAACRAELNALAALSVGLAAVSEPAASADAEAFWQVIQPQLGAQRAPAPWRSWLPGLLLLAVYGLFGLLLMASPLLRLAGLGLALPVQPLGWLSLALGQLPLPAPTQLSILMLGLFGSAGALYLIWLGFWWSRHVANAEPAHSA